MAYFKIDNIDFSMCVNSLSISNKAAYNAETNAAGNTVVDYINTKRNIKVGIIPLDASKATDLLTAIEKFSVSISFLNPITNSLEELVPCIIPSNGVEYHTIQANKVMLKEFDLTFQEL